MNDERRYCIVLDIATKNLPKLFFLEMKSSELMLTTKLISLIPIPCYAVNTNLFITTTPHRFIQFETELKLESTTI